MKKTALLFALALAPLGIHAEEQVDPTTSETTETQAAEPTTGDMQPAAETAPALPVEEELAPTAPYEEVYSDVSTEQQPSSVQSYALVYKVRCDSTESPTWANLQVQARAMIESLPTDPHGLDNCWNFLSTVHESIQNEDFHGTESVQLNSYITNYKKSHEPNTLIIHFDLVNLGETDSDTWLHITTLAHELQTSMNLDSDSVDFNHCAMLSNNITTFANEAKTIRGSYGISLS